MRYRSVVVAIVHVILIAVAAGSAYAQAVDPYNPSTNGIVRAMAVQADGKVLIGGDFDTVNGTARSRLARLNVDGTLDTTFDPAPNAGIYAIAVQPDGRIIVSGDFITIGGTLRFNIARLMTNGSADPTFNVGANGTPLAIAIEPDGQILIGGVFTGVGGGTGTTPRNRLARINENGTLDAGFDPGADAAVYSIGLNRDGSMYVGGAFTTIGGGGTGSALRNRLAKLDSSGSVLPFNPGANSYVTALVVRPDGSVYVAGNFTGLGNGTGTVPRQHLGLISPGEVVESFDPGTNGNIVTMALQADGKLIVGGVFSAIGGGTGTITRYGIARLDANGIVDSFNPGASGTAVLGVTLQGDGRLLVGGLFTGLGGGTGTTSRTNIGRIINDTAPTESLTLSGGTITWLRGGSAPEIWRAAFDYSTDGATFSTLAASTTVAGGWQVTGASLPADPNLRIRVQGYTSGAFQSSSSALVSTSAPASGVEMIENGSFATGTTSWSTFALPDASGMAFNVTGQVFQFYRTGTQAVAFQQTGLPLPAFAPLTATFSIGNSDTVRKRISVLVHDSNFTDLSVCTFWLPASAPLSSYTLKTHTTRPWSDATISFYAASVNGAGNTTGFYRVDNVSLRYQPADTTAETTCIDAFAPTPPGGVASSNLIANGDFSGGLTSWGLFGQITGAVNGGVFEFVKNAGAPAGVVLQATGQTATAGELLTATFQLGNTSAVRKRVTVIVHDNDFSDLTACTFWLPPGQPLSTYTYRTYTTEAWTNATISFYPATVGAEQWIRLDNVELKRTPGVTLAAVLCVEPGGVVPASPPAFTSTGGAPSPSAPVVVPAASAPVDGWVSDGFVSLSNGSIGLAWIAAANAAGVRVLELDEPLDLTSVAGAVLRFRSHLAAPNSRAEVQASIDGGDWELAARVASSDTAIPIEIDLSPYVGSVIRIRLVLTTTDGGSESDAWTLEFAP